MIALLLAWILQGTSVPLENAYVKVSRDLAPCAAAETPGCGDRVVVALGAVEVTVAGRVRTLSRGDVIVVPRGESYRPPARGMFLEIAIKPDHPPVEGPAEIMPPDKNTLLHDAGSFFVFEEKLDPGETRTRHSHSQRVVIVLNATRLQQWPDGAPALFRDQIPDDVRFNPPVTHVVKTVGDRPLRNIVIEFRPGR